MENKFLNKDTTESSGSQWISVKDRMPKNWQYVVTLTAGGHCFTSVFYRYDLHKTGTWGEGEFEVLYWLPLPSMKNLEGYTPYNFMRTEGDEDDG